MLGLAEGISGRAKEFGTSPKGLLYAILGNNAPGSDLSAWIILLTEHLI
jgi:hypothetical protein